AVGHSSRKASDSMRIAIVGNGKMGQAVARLAEARGHSIHTIVAAPENPAGAALTTDRLAGADVAIEFTRPDAAAANLERLIEAGVPALTRAPRLGDADSPAQG